MTTTLITGANGGLGFHTAQRLIEAGHDVWVTARDARSAREAAGALNARFAELDVTDDASVAAAAPLVAADLASLGYVVAIPELFWRIAPGWTSTHDEGGVAASMNVTGSGNDATRSRVAVTA